MEPDEIKVYINKAGYSEEDQKQMMNAIKAFKGGQEQPEGRFKILGVLHKEEG